MAAHQLTVWLIMPSTNSSSAKNVRTICYGQLLRYVCILYYLIEYFNQSTIELHFVLLLQRGGSKQRGSCADSQ